MSILLLNSNKGHKKLLKNKGYVYFFDGNYKDNSYWESEFRKVKGCKGRVTTIREPNGELKVIKESPHNHVADAINGKVQTAIDEVKNRAETSTAILRGYKRNLCDEILHELPSDEALGKRIKRKRKEEYGKENLSGIDFSLPEHCKSINGQDFLIDEYNKNGKRCIVFSTPDLLKMLCESPIVFMDGTFKISPTGFQQLYSIHASLEVEG